MAPPRGHLSFGIERPASHLHGARGVCDRTGGRHPLEGSRADARQQTRDEILECQGEGSRVLHRRRPLAGLGRVHSLGLRRTQLTGRRVTFLERLLPVTPRNDEPEWELAILGLDEAIGRLRVSLVRRRGHEHLIPVLEALSWLYALDELEKRRLTGNVHRHVCDGSDDGRVHRALIWARGKMHHNMLDLGVIRSASSDSGPSVRWVGAHDLLRWAADRDTRPDLHSRAEDFDRLVAGRPLEEPLRRARDFVSRRLSTDTGQTSQGANSSL